MTAPTHQMCGLSFGLTTYLVFVEINPLVDPIETLIFFGLIILGALLPDLDHPNSRLGRRIPILSYPLYWLFGHRTWTHSLLFVLITLLIGMVAGQFLNWSLLLRCALAIGVLSHVLGDYFFDGGVPLFHPFNKNRFKFIVTAKTRRPGSVGMSENIVLLIFFLVNAYMVKVLVSNYQLLKMMTFLFI